MGVRQLLMVRNEKGLTDFCFGKTYEELMVYLHQKYPDSNLEKSISANELWQMLDDRHTNPPTLDLQGTSFQLSVWNELRRIPYGTTKSYKEIAIAIDKPKAYRAVALACSQNPLALFIPCHRVIASNGKISGYRWGVELKRMFIGMEKDRKWTNKI